MGGYPPEMSTAASGPQPRHTVTLVCFAAAALVDGALIVIQLIGMVTGPAWQGNLYPGAVIAVLLTALVTMTALVGFATEWRRPRAPKMFRLAVACLSLPLLLVVAASVLVP